MSVCGWYNNVQQVLLKTPTRMLKDFKRMQDIQKMP